jgi:hypothetical protein
LLTYSNESITPDINQNKDLKPNLYRFLDRFFIVYSNSEILIQNFDLIFSNLKLSEKPSLYAQYPTFYLIENQEEQCTPYSVHSNDSKAYYTDDPLLAASLLLSFVSQYFFAKIENLMIIHGAVLEYESKGFILSGDAGSGKTTLCLNFLNESLGFLSDELAPINLDTGLIIPYPRAVFFEKDNKLLKSSIFNKIDKNIILKDGEGEKFILPPDSMTSNIVKNSCSLNDIILISPNFGGDSSLENISNIEGFSRIINHWLNLPYLRKNIRYKVIEKFSHLIPSIQFHQLILGEPEEAIFLIKASLHEKKKANIVNQQDQITCVLKLIEDAINSS